MSAPKYPHYAAQPDTAAPVSTTGRISSLFNSAKAALQDFQVDNVPHALRQSAVQYNPAQSPHTMQLQLLIKAQKGVVVDTEALARETKRYSKNLMEWIRENMASSNADIQDVGDRLGYLTYRVGQLYEEYASHLEASRVVLKDSRSYEQTLAPHRDRLRALESQVSKLENDPKADMNKLEGLQAEVAAMKAPDSQLSVYENSALALKRSKLIESFEGQFKAMLEIGEKLAVTARYGEAFLQGLKDEDTNGPSVYRDQDFERSKHLRGGLEDTLAGWKYEKALHAPLNIDNLVKTPSRSNTGPFADTHSTELSAIPSDADHDPVRQSVRFAAPPPTHAAPPQHPSLNTAPVQIPPSVSPPVAPLAAVPNESPIQPPSSQPTVAETGKPIEGTNGPATGVLKPPENPTPASASKADEARAELENRFNAYSTGGASGSQAPGVQPPAAEEELPQYKEKI